jgi:hypothetical protein
MQEHIIIKDDKGEIHIFFTIRELVEYLDGFQMSFLPDNFSYRIKPQATNRITTIRRKKHHV